MKPFSIEEVNNTLSCHIYPNARFPNGLYLTYETCPETYDNKTIKAIRFCCLSIMFLVIEKSVYKQTQDFLRYNSSSVLVGPAVLFNVLSLVVLSKFKRLKGSAQISTTFYMKCLCILDTLTIVSKFVYEVIVVRNGLREHPLVITSFLCKFLGFSECLCAVSAIYVLIAMSIDKLICVLAPLKVSQILTTNKARFIFSCILFSSALMASYNLFDRRVFILNSNLDDDVDHVDTSSSSSSNHNHNHNSPPDDSEINSNHSSTSSSSSTSNSNSNGATQNNNQQTTTSPNYRISYDCDSNWPELKNDWILINNIVRVFLPILVLCVCNSWIAIALAKARRHTEALFNTNGVSNSNSSEGGGLSKHRRVLSATSSSIRYEKTKNTRAPPLKLAFYSKYRSKSRSDLESREDEPTSEGAVTSRSLVSNRLLKPASSSALAVKIRKHSADSYISYDSESELAAKGNIINKLYHQNSRRSGGSGSGNGGSPPHRLSNVADYRGNLMINSSVPRPSGYINIRAQKNTQHISIMLFAVSIGFVILNLPFAIRTIFHRQYQEDFKIFDYLYHDDNSFITSTSKTEIQTAIKYEFFTTLTHLLLDLNYIANFFLYFFSGSKFRAQLFAMFGCSKKKPGELASNAPTRATAAAVGAKANTPPKFTSHTNNPIVIVHSSSRHTIDRRISSIDNNCNSPPSNALDDNDVDATNNNDTNSNKTNNHIKKNQSCARRLFSKCLFFRKSNDSIHHRQKIMKQNQKVRYEEISLTDPKRLSFRQANKNCI